MVKTRKGEVILFDIETAPSLGYYFNLYQEGNILEVKEHWYLLSFAWKKLGEKKTHVLCLDDFTGTKEKKQRDLVKALWEMADGADVLIAHNGRAFDIKKMNALFVKHELKPPTPRKDIDTKLVAKRYFKFDSNSLDNLADYLGIGRKLQTGGKDLWFKCMEGDKKAWSIMCKYNVWDVVLLEKVYLRLRPFIENHPNMNLLQGTMVCCPLCGSSHITKHKARPTKVGWKQQWQCQDCGGYTTDNKSVRAAELS